MAGRVGALVVVLTVAMLGCGGEPATPTGEPWPKAWAYPENQFVIDRLSVPISGDEARALAFDLDGNGVLDNQFGNVVVALGGGLDWSPQGDLDKQMARGDNITLLSLYASALDSSSRANLWTFLGASQPLTDGPQPGGTFAIDEMVGSPEAWLGGRIAGRTGTFGGPEATMWIKGVLLGDTVLELRAARVEFTSSKDAQRLEGKLGGAVPESQLEADVLPALAAEFDAEIQASCAMDSWGECACPAGSRMETVQLALDADGDCRVTLDEFRNNNLVKAFLKGDVTLPSGERALSLGIGFTAVAAHFDHRAPPGLDGGT